MTATRTVVTTAGTYQVLGPEPVRTQALVLAPLLDTTLPTGVGNRSVSGAAGRPC